MNYNHTNDHVHRSHVRDDTYVTLYWPKNATLKDLEHIKALVNWQLDIFLDSARKETESEERARLEVESWSAAAAQEAKS